MSLNKRRTVGPILDSRTIDNPNVPKHNNLNSPRGAALEQRDTVLKDGDGPAIPNRFVGRLRNVPLGTLDTLSVFGPALFTDTISVPTPTAGNHAVNRDYADSLTVTPGNGLAKIGTILSLDNAAITSVGTLTGLSVTGAIVTPMEYVTPADGDTITASNTSPGVIVNPAGAIDALTVVFPETPVNGQRFSLHTTQDITALTVTATFAPGNAPPAGMTAGTPLRWIYSTDLGGWVNA